jgi:CBS domain-containing protein
MRVLADVMTRGVFAVEHGLGLREAARGMVERGVGAAIVLDGERLVGILTERDVLLAVASDRDRTAAVEDCMTRHPETVEPTDTSDHAATLMIHGGFRHLPVVDGGRVVGIVSIRDLMRDTLSDISPRGA